MSKRLLLCMDIQRDYFPGGRFPLPQMQEAVLNTALLLRHFRENKEPVIHVFHADLEDDAPFFKAGSDGTAIDSRVKPLQGELTVEKHFPNSFRETPLEAEIRKHAPSEVVFCGAMTNMCIDASVRAAADLGFACRLIEDACAACALEFNGVNLEARQVHAAFAAALASAYAAVDTAKGFINIYGQA